MKGLLACGVAALVALAGCANSSRSVSLNQIEPLRIEACVAPLASGLERVLCETLASEIRRDGRFQVAADSGDWRAIARATLTIVERAEVMTKGSPTAKHEVKVELIDPWGGILWRESRDIDAGGAPQDDELWRAAAETAIAIIVRRM